MIHKTIAILLTSSILLFSAQEALAQKEIGHLNYAQLLQLIPEAQAANDSLASLQAALQAESDAMVTAFQAEVATLQNREQSGELSPKQLQDESARLQAKQQKIQEFGAGVQQQLTEKQQSLLEPVLAKMQAAVNDVAEEKGLSHVLDTSSGVLLYLNAELDILEDVKAKLGLTSP